MSSEKDSEIEESRDFSNWSREELIAELRKREQEIETLKHQRNRSANQIFTSPPPAPLPKLSGGDLTRPEVTRYSRQLILPEIGPRGQRSLLGSSVLVVGCGGLGCPAAIYLAGAGVGRIGLVDYDTVEISNLHRQVLHTEDGVGVSKSASISSAIRGLNSGVEVVAYDLALNSRTALGVVGDYDVVLDCTDNVATRYLLNDACVLAGKPLVSGSALRFDGQLSVYHYDEGPCFRCVHPRPPPPETVTNCSDGGVVGAVPGVIGCMQALEAIKIITKSGQPLTKKLLIFDGLKGEFMTVRLRERRPGCDVCGDRPNVTELIDYAEFCGAAPSDKDKTVSLLDRESRVTVEEYKKLVQNKTPHLLVDVRAPVEIEICALPHALNVPLKDIDKPKSVSDIEDRLREMGTRSVVCVCRRGNDSQIAVQKLMWCLSGCEIKDIIGGLTAWANRIDSSMPVY